MTSLTVCYGITDNCENLSDSYGEICVWCNCCGRVDKATMYDCQLSVYKSHLVETANKLTDPDYQLPIQQKNILAEIPWWIKKIKQAQRLNNGRG